MKTQAQADDAFEVERRQHPRHTLKEGVIAFFGSTPSLIVNISPLGMAVNYIVLGEEENGQVTFDLFSPQTKTYLPDIPGKMVREDHPEPAPFYSILQTRKLGIKFEELSSEQLKKLDEFIAANKSGVN